MEVTVLTQFRNVNEHLLMSIEPGEPSVETLIKLETLTNRLDTVSLGKFELGMIMSSLMKCVLIEEKRSELTLIDNDGFYKKIAYSERRKQLTQFLKEDMRELIFDANSQDDKAKCIGRMYVGIFNLMLTFEVLNETMNELENETK